MGNREIDNDTSSRFRERLPLITKGRCCFTMEVNLHLWESERTLLSQTHFTPDVTKSTLSLGIGPGG